MNEYKLVSPYGASVSVKGSAMHDDHIWIGNEWVAQVPDNWLIIITRDVKP